MHLFMPPSHERREELRFLRTNSFLPPNQRWENGASCPSRGFIIDLRGIGQLLFHFIKIEALHLGRPQ